jgi:transcriptional regulator with XRE-family HTH domain
MPFDDAISSPDPIDVAIGARIRLRRKTLGVSQGALADQIGVSFQQVQKYERGMNRVSGSTLVAIGRALDTSVGWLVGEEGQISDAGEELLTALATTGAQELLEAYSAIPRAATRAALLSLARELAETG